MVSSRSTSDAGARLLSGFLNHAKSLRFVWLLFSGVASGLTGQDRFFLLAGAVGVGQFGCKGILQVFNKLDRIGLKDGDEYR